MSSAKKNHQDYEALLKSYDQAQAQLVRTKIREKAAKKNLKSAEKNDASKAETEVARLELEIAKAKRKGRKAGSEIAKIRIKQWIKANAKHEKSYKLIIEKSSSDDFVEQTPIVETPSSEIKTKRPYNRRPKSDSETSSRSMESDSEIVEGKAGTFIALEEAEEASRALDAEAEKKDRRPRRTSAAVKAEKEAAQAALKEKGDNFTIIEGIGPAVTNLLHEAGIQSFADLAASNIDEIRTMLKARRNNIADPATWAQQAQMVVDNDWESLQQLQQTLKRTRS